MNKYLTISQDHVACFMRAGKQTTLDNIDGERNKQQEKLYLSLIAEEFDEFLVGYFNDDVVETADGIADTIWCLLAYASTRGINIAPVWEEVRLSNMSKFSLDGEPAQFREDGKILKPDSYFKPNIAKALGLAEE